MLVVRYLYTMMSRWEKDGSPVGMFPGKYSWSGEVEEGDCSINIFHAEKEFDHGKGKLFILKEKYAIFIYYVFIICIVRD